MYFWPSQLHSIYVFICIKYSYLQAYSISNAHVKVLKKTSQFSSISFVHCSSRTQRQKINKIVYTFWLERYISTAFISGKKCSASHNKLQYPPFLWSRRSLPGSEVSWPAPHVHGLCGEVSWTFYYDLMICRSTPIDDVHLAGFNSDLWVICVCDVGYWYLFREEVLFRVCMAGVDRVGTVQWSAVCPPTHHQTISHVKDHLSLGADRSSVHLLNTTH